MPELPEVETTRRGIAPHLENRRIASLQVRQPRLRWPVPDDLAARLAGQRIARIDRRGKYLLMVVDTGQVLWHLGMSGSLRLVEVGNPLKPHDHLVLSLTEPDGRASALELRFHDPRRFGCCLWVDGPAEEHTLLRELGPEPLSDGFGDDHLFRLSRGRTAPVKAFIMDSHVVVGVGNIYANEALFRVGIHPLREAGRISAARYAALTGAIREILAQAVTRGGTTLRDFVNGNGEPGYFQQELDVYGRAGEPCRRCDQPLTEVRLSARSTVYCTRCQR